MVNIDLFHNGGLLMYSFTCMIISLSDLIRKKVFLCILHMLTRLERLIIIYIKEYVNRPPLWNRSIGGANQSEQTRSGILEPTISFFIWQKLLVFLVFYSDWSITGICSEWLASLMNITVVLALRGHRVKDLVLITSLSCHFVVEVVLVIVLKVIYYLCLACL